MLPLRAVGAQQASAHKKRSVQLLNSQTNAPWTWVSVNIGVVWDRGWDLLFAISSPSN